MSTLNATPLETRRMSEEPVLQRAALRFVVPVARVLYAFIFIASGLTLFSPQTAAYASAQSVPFANVVVPISGILAVAGGLSVALGYRARIGAWLLVLFLVPVTLMMHAFWRVPDPMLAALQRIMFLKNVSMLGGALLLTYFGAGPLSLDRARVRRVR
jgi:putative oxidoreductase